MCGFCGFVNHIDNADEVLRAMGERIRHRGPDDANQYIDEFVALGFRRLSIIDLEGGNQPIYNEDQSLVLVFNGEIYNYRAIKKDLLAKGHKFYTESDSEVLIHSYEEYGTGMLDKLRGMFAFVIYDKKNQKLFGARDPFGIKPFYYYQNDNDFLFGSEIKAFIDYPHFKKELNTNALSDYLSFGFNPQDETMFKNVYKLPPGHCFIHQEGEMLLEKWFDVSYTPNYEKSLDEHVAAIEAVMTDSVKHHMISDVEVGSFLSSGVDSSYLAREASELTALKLFSVGYKEERYSELPYVEKFAEEIKSKVYAKIVTPDDYFNTVPKVAYHLDEPLADASVFSLYYVANEARKQVKVSLSGEGSDELFTGYNSYKGLINMAKYQTIPLEKRQLLAALAEQDRELRDPIFQETLDELVEKFPGTTIEKRANLFIFGVKPIEERYFGVGSLLMGQDIQQRLLKDPTLIKDPIVATNRFLAKVAGQDDLSKAQYLDFNMWLANDILLKADKISMANSLEVRVPFLDVEVLKVASTIPAEYRVNDVATKIPLRKAAAKKLNNTTANKPKLGFPVPMREWIKEDDHFERFMTLFASDAAQRFFNTDELGKMLDEHRAEVKDHFRQIWLIFAFLVWYQEFFENEANLTPLEREMTLIAK